MSNDKGFLYRTWEAVQDNLLGVVVSAFILGAAGTWAHSMYSTHVQGQTEKARIEAGYRLHHGDINGNTLVDKFYLIDGKPAVVELDGKPVVQNPTIDDEFCN